MMRHIRHIWYGYVQCPDCGGFRGSVSVESSNGPDYSDDVYILNVCHSDPKHAMETAELEFKMNQIYAALERGGDVEFIDLDTDTRG